MNHKIKQSLLLAATVAGSTVTQNVMALAAQETQAGLYHYTNRWAYGCVPYVVSSGAKGYLNYINAAVKEWNDKLNNVTIFPKDNAPTSGICAGKTFTKYLEFREGSPCHTPSDDAHGQPLDKTSRVIFISGPSCLDSDNENKPYRDTTHEVGHALGFVHEHQRADAGEYIFVDRDNILPKVPATELLPEPANSRILTDNNAYDYQSIMHYHPTTIGIEVNGVKQTTLVFINTDNPPPADINNFLANNRGLSTLDQIAADNFYRPNVADMGVMIERGDACSQDRFNKNKCTNNMTAHQIVLEYQLINHGPYDSGRVDFSIPVPVDATDFVLTDDPTNSCEPKGNIYQCSVTNALPVTRITVKALVTATNDEAHSYTASVNSVVAEDDFATNDSISRNFDAKTAGGFFLHGFLIILTIVKRRKKMQLRERSARNALSMAH